MPFSTFNSSLKTIHNRKRKLSKRLSDSEQLINYLDGDYDWPGSRPSTPCVRSARSCQDCDVLNGTNQSLVKECESLQSKMKDIEKESDEVKKTKKLAPKVVNQMKKRKNKKIKKLKNDIKKLESDLSGALTSRDSTYTLQGRTVLAKRRKKCLECDFRKNMVKTLHGKFAELQHSLSILENENLQLKEQIEEMRSESNIVCTKQDGKTYTPVVREVIYHCLTKNVALENIRKVVTFAIEKLANKTLSDFPSVSSCGNIVREMDCISKMQVSDELKDKKDTTVKFDGTTKAKTHWVETQISTKDQTFTIGLTKTPDGTAATYCGSVKLGVDNLGKHSIQRGHEDTKDIILSSITNSMTDRCTVNTAAMAKLSEVKRTVDSEATPIRTFFCGVHPLDSFSKACDKVFKDCEGEMGVTSGGFNNRSQSQTCAFSYAIAKVFHKDGSGVPVEMKTYLESHGIRQTLVHYFVGERFHIFFHNGGSIFFLWDLITNFIENVWGAPNRLLQAVQKDLNVPFFKVACRALGILGKLFTAPWLRFTMVDRPVLELNPFYTDAEVKLLKWSQDSTDLLLGHSWIGEVDFQDNRVFQSLTAPHDNDEDTKTLLQKLCATILVVLQRQCKDQLPGGQYYELSDDLLSKSSSCKANNISGERVFAMLDSSIKRAPNASMDLHEGKILFSVNHTKDWLEQQPNTEKHGIIAAARKQARQLRKDRDIEERRIKKLQVERLKEKEREKVKKEIQSRESKEDMLNSLFKHGGLWQSEDDMKDSLHSLIF